MSRKKEKKCRGKCGLVKPVSEYGVEKLGRDGLKTKCKTCIREYDKDLRQRNRKAVNTRTRELFQENPNERRAINNTYRRANPDKRSAWDAKRRAAKLQRTMAWADDWKIRQFYIVAQKLTDTYGVEFHVDHIVPLQGKLVSGLHVENNLQVITATENLSKNNKFIPG